MKNQTNKQTKTCSEGNQINYLITYKKTQHKSSSNNSNIWFLKSENYFSSIVMLPNVDPGVVQKHGSAAPHSRYSRSIST